MEWIDARGMVCPIPVVRARKALEKNGAGDVTVRVDNYTAVQNLEKMAGGLGYRFKYEKFSDFEFDVTLEQNSAAIRPAVPSGASGAVVSIGDDAIGGETPGKALMKAFIYSLSELAAPPEAVLFSNSGARLTSAGAETLDDIQSLAVKGTRILTCGTSVDFYRLPPPAVGGTASINELVSVMSKASRVITI